ncbi:hypothetical protein [Sphingomonas sp. Leaf21]|jgi:hypothetical protein|uniref:hypothetical protein n=1 Tax=Sphingomonas sp. Leaf21 TaxID=2876550 RepID=UPI001E2F20ED|nr:hypothetical protein [Sphingomonas sp. Leaf21]
MFLLLTASSLIFAICFGERDARWAAAWVLAAVIATAVAEALNRNWGSVHLTVAAIDLCLLAGLGHLMLTSRSYWPIWMVAAQLLTVLCHVAAALAGPYNQRVYTALATLWSIPCLLSLVVGVVLDRRATARLRAG